MICLKPFGRVRIWGLSSHAIYACDGEGSSGLRRLTGDITEKTLTVKESFKLRFLQNVVLLCQGNGDTVCDAKSRRMIDF